MSFEFKICPSCNDEFTLAAVECEECGVPLVYPGSEPAEEASEFPGVEDLRCVRVGPLPWTRALSEALGEAGIAHRVEHDTRSEEEGGAPEGRFGGLDLYGTWVTHEDYDDAKEIDEGIFTGVDPDEEVAESEGDDVCPACQTPLAPDAMECADCGLSFG